MYLNNLNDNLEEDGGTEDALTVGLEAGPELPVSPSD